MLGFHMIATNDERSIVGLATIANISKEEALRVAEIVGCQPRLSFAGAESKGEFGRHKPAS